MKPHLPIYQRLWNYIWYLATGLLALGASLEIINTSLSIITPKITYIITSTILLVWLISEIIIRKWSLPWITKSNTTVRIKNLTSHQRLWIAGCVLLLWIPRLQDLMSESRVFRTETVYRGQLCDDLLIVKNFDANLGVEHYAKQFRSKSSDKSVVNHVFPSIGLDIIGLQESEEAKIAPFIVVKTLSIEPIQSSELYTMIDTGCGRVDTVDYFNMILSPRRDKIFGAPFVPSGSIRDKLNVLIPSTKDNIRYFALKKNDREVFLIDIYPEPGYTYRFQIGVPYDFEGTQAVQWIDEEFIVIAPLEAHHIDVLKEEKYIGFYPIDPPFSDWDERIRRDNLKVEQYPYFSIHSIMDN